MCSSYRPPSRESIEEYFGVLGDQPFKLETYPGYEGPMIRLARELGSLECVLGNFGLMPHWAKPTLARSTYNARTESVSEKASFRNAWKKAQHCVIPAAWIYEPNYESGKAVRWKIQRKDGRPFGIAGLWEWRPDADNADGKLSFTMLTVNADSHVLMKRFHAPGDEKRMIVILDPDQYEGWLRATVDESMAFLRTYPADELSASPAPKPPKGAGDVQQAA